MGRKERILKHISKKGCGIEIGPSHRPITPKKEGYNVHNIDHLSREGLIEKYKNEDVNTKNIEEVDFIWEGQTYSELTGKHNYYDWVIASHVIEHVPDLIGFLNECDAILKDNGVISLVVPDKRYCFDHYRPITGISKLIDNHFQKAKVHSPGTVAEFILNTVSKSGNVTWNSSDTGGNYNFLHSLEDALQGMKSAKSRNEYIDTHAWCFIPHSFRLIIHDLFCLGLIQLQEVEFYVTLGRTGKGIDKSRLEMLAIVESEINEEVAPMRNIKDKIKNVLKRSSLLTNMVRRFRS
jgi:predicted SAM-dependent methyltransferase